MGCGGPWASAWNLGNHGNGPAGDNKYGMEFQSSQPSHRGMGKFGKVFLFCFVFLFSFVFNPGLRKAQEGATVFQINGSLRSPPTESQGARFSGRLYFHFILSICL